MEVPGGTPAEALDDENREFKKLHAKSMLDVATLLEALRKNF